jgi:hypothetical protein
MPTRRYSVATGTGGSIDTSVTEAVGAATVTQAIEVTIEFGATVLNGGTGALTKTDVLLGLDAIRNYIVERIWPPA